MAERININVNKFFEIYNSDEALRERIRIAEENYPGSLEIRESLVQDILIPVAEEMGLPFTVMDLFVYESRLKASRQTDEEISEDAEPLPEDQCRYWLVDRGWKSDEATFCGDKK